MVHCVARHFRINNEQSQEAVRPGGHHLKCAGNPPDSEALRSLPVKTAYLDGELGATEFGTPSCTKSDICPQLRASSRR
jgi:hypothetical protein